MRAWDAQWNDPKSARRDSSVPEDQSKLHKTGREPATNASSTAEPANAKDGMEEEGQDKQDSSTNSQPLARQGSTLEIQSSKKSSGRLLKQNLMKSVCMGSKWSVLIGSKLDGQPLESSTSSSEMWSKENK